VEAEGDSFAVMGLENVSRALRESALSQLRTLHRCAGVVHGDLRLGNIVRDKLNASRAKLIDFGQSFWCDRSSGKQFAHEVSALKRMLQM
jgi:Ser/Thr protein kinase RdoA (MazF antagonist)